MYEYYVQIPDYGSKILVTSRKFDQTTIHSNMQVSMKLFMEGYYWATKLVIL